jgi:hypothetical protein
MQMIGQLHAATVFAHAIFVSLKVVFTGVLDVV